VPKGLDGRGKSYNSTSPEEVNRGVYGKFSIEQLEERTALHAKRLHDRFPTIQNIVDHFYKEYNIQISYNSEKEWANTDKNRATILAKMEDMIRGGELEIRTISRQTLLNSLSEGARAEAGFLKGVKSKTTVALNSLDASLAPWEILGIQKRTYLKASKEQLEEWKPRLDIDLKVKKDTVTMLKSLSNIMRDHSEEVRKIVKQADELGSKISAEDSSLHKKLAHTKHQKSIKDATAENKITGSQDVEYNPVSMEELRKAAGYED